MLMAGSQTCAPHVVHAEAIQLFTSLIRKVHPELSSIHRDTKNACIPDLVIPLTRFTGGELFLKTLVANCKQLASAPCAGTKFL